MKASSLLPRSRHRIAWLIASLFVAWPLAAQTYTASPIASGNYSVYPYNFTGIVTAPDRSSGFTDYGSGAVVKNPKVVYSCAHVVFDTDAVDPWLNNVRWYRAWSSSSQPTTSAGQLLRAYYYFQGYSAAALANQASAAAFSQDFVVHYAFENTANGGYAGYYDDGVSQLKSTKTKLITGYPIGNYSSGDSRKYLMHNTGPFTRAFSVSSGDYLRIDEVSTGHGNSGGPIWVSDGNTYYYTGVLVSGLARSQGDGADTAGVYGVDSSSLSLIDAAIGAVGGSVSAPVISSQPTSRRVNAGQAASFSVTATGSGLAYRWLFNGATISGATSATLSFSAVSLQDAGSYQVIVSNTGGEARSSVVTLAVDSVPVISAQPTSQAVSAGNSVSLSVTVQNSSGATYQWKKDGVAISGATAATYSISSVTTAQAGSYTVTITNSTGSTTSSAAVLTVTSPNPGRLINLSILTNIATGTDTFTVGFVSGGSGTSGTKPLLVRAVGPSLTTLGVTGVLADPFLEFFAGSTKIDENDNWGGGTTLSGTFTAVGAFPYASTASKDAAIYNAAVASGSNSMRVRGVGGATGAVIAELYDCTTTSAFRATTARLVNVSVLKEVGPGFIVGFVVGGATSLKVLVRAVGPGLNAVGVPLSSVMPDPKVTLYAGSAKVSENDNWAGDALIAAAMKQVGAFTIPATSKDAALLATLQPGSYSVQITGVANGGGQVIAEVYEVP